MDPEMANYCREEYGSLSFYDEMADQCLCLPGATFDGKRLLTPVPPPLSFSSYPPSEKLESPASCEQSDHDSNKTSLRPPR